MFGKRKREFQEEIADAVETRDALLAGVADAVTNVDDLKDELLAEYQRANGIEEEF